MNRVALLLDRLSFEPSRNGKLRLMTEYFRHTEDPERGWALAALTGSLTFRHAKPAVVRSLLAERMDPVLFEMSYDFVGDLSETVALLWGATGVVQRDDNLSNRPPLLLSEIVDTLESTERLNLGSQLATWLDALDETGRWALLKLITGALRVGVSARLAKTAVAELGGVEPDEIEVVWHGQSAPYLELFRWLAGKGEGRHPSIPRRSGQRCSRNRWTKRHWTEWTRAISWPNGNGTASGCRSRAAWAPTANAFCACIPGRAKT